MKQVCFLTLAFLLGAPLSHAQFFPEDSPEWSNPSYMAPTYESACRYQMSRLFLCGLLVTVVLVGATLPAIAEIPSVNGLVTERPDPATRTPPSLESQLQEIPDDPPPERITLVFPILSFANQCGSLWIMDDRRDPRRNRLTIRTGVGPTFKAAEDAARRACSVAAGMECPDEYTVADPVPNNIFSMPIHSRCCGPDVPGGCSRGTAQR